MKTFVLVSLAVMFMFVGVAQAEFKGYIEAGPERIVSQGVDHNFMAFEFGGSYVTGNLEPYGEVKFNVSDIDRRGIHTNRMGGEIGSKYHLGDGFSVKAYFKRSIEDQEDPHDDVWTVRLRKDF